MHTLDHPATFPAPVARPVLRFRGEAPQLTAREREIAALVAEGLTNAGIGARLWLSPRTVQSHVASAMEKLEASCRTSLAVEAIRWGIVPLFPVDAQRAA